MSFGGPNAMTTYKIRYFDPSTIATNSMVLLIGRRGSGKSTASKDLMYHFKDRIKQGICISKTDKVNEFWQGIMPKMLIHYEFSESILYNLLEMQDKKWSKIKRDAKREGRTPDPKEIEPVFLILDDMAFDKGFLTCNALREIAYNSRHYNIMTLITMQYLMDIGPGLRSQFDWVISFSDNIRANRIRFYEYFAGTFPTFASFEQTFFKCTEGRECMVLHNGSRSHNPEDAVFYYQATPDLDFKLCDEKLWRISDMLQREEGEDSGEGSAGQIQFGGDQPSNGLDEEDFDDFNVEEFNELGDVERFQSEPEGWYDSNANTTSFTQFPLGDGSSRTSNVASLKDMRRLGLMRRGGFDRDSASRMAGLRPSELQRMRMFDVKKQRVMQSQIPSHPPPLRRSEAIHPRDPTMIASQSAAREPASLLPNPHVQAQTVSVAPVAPVVSAPRTVLERFGEKEKLQARARKRRKMARELLMEERKARRIAHERREWKCRRKDAVEKRFSFIQQQLSTI